MAQHEGVYANPHTSSHLAGIEANRAVTIARRKVAASIGGEPRGVVFTSGATEANNLAILGVAKASTQRRKIVTLVSEHSSVLEPAKSLRENGFRVEILKVQSDGLVDLAELSQKIDSDTALVSVMHVNNETGVIQPVNEIARLCSAVGALFHSDCAQSLGKLHVDVQHLGFDFVTLSGHKAYGPKGVGALYVSDSHRVQIKPLCFGGGQEGSLRPGTLPVPLCVGFGEACRVAAESVDSDSQRLSRLADEMFSNVSAFFPKAKLNGSTEHRVPGTLNICFPGATGDDLLNAFNGIQASSGSACSSTDVEPSRVLMAYGLSRELADASIRISLGRFTTDKEIERATWVILHGLWFLGLVNSKP